MSYWTFFLLGGLTDSGVAQLVARQLWERAGLIHEGKSATPQPAGTLPEAGSILEKLLLKKRPRPHERPQIKQIHNRV